MVPTTSKKIVVGVKLEIQIQRTFKCKLLTKFNNIPVSTMAKLGNQRSLLFHVGAIGFFFPFTLCILFSALVSLLLYFYRILHRMAAKIFRSDLKGILPPLNHIFTHNGWEDSPTFNVCIVLIFEGELSVENLREKFNADVLSSKKSNRELEYSELRKYWTRFGSYFFWKEEENFDIKRHIRPFDYQLPVKCSDTKDAIITDEGLQIIFAKLLNEPWSRGQSPWEWLVLQNYSPDGESISETGRTATIFRINHALGEGYSVHNMLVKVASSQINPMLQRPEASLSSKSVEILRGITKTYQLVTEFFRFLLDLKLDDYTWMAQSVDDGSSKYFTVRTEEIPVETVKRIRRKFEVKFITVVMSAVLAAFEKMAQDAGITLPKGINFVTPIPMPNHPGGLRNNVSGRLIQLPFGIKDPVKRLRAVQDAILNNGEVLHNLTFALFKFSGMLPTSIVTMNPPSGYTVDCTTIPGPEEPCYIAGCRMRNVFGSFASGPGGVDGEGMCAATAVSFYGNLTITLVTTTKRSPTYPKIMQENFNRYIQEEVFHLLGVATSAPVTADTPLFHC